MKTNLDSERSLRFVYTLATVKGLLKSKTDVMMSSAILVIKVLSHWQLPSEVAIMSVIV